jgi:gliding motility-associated-like protein
MYRFRYLLLLFTTLISSPLLAQITASDSSGCAPLVNVTFTGPTGATNITWDFDDGTGSNLAQPQHTFINPGTYTVLYNATVAGGPVSYSLIIDVYGKPDAHFRATTPVSGCLPLNVTFLDSSFGGGGSPITLYEWSFGDGGTISGAVPNPSYTYTLPGSFTVSLKVTDQHGCDTSIVKPGYVNTSIPPFAQISTIPDPPAACIPPLNVQFSAAGSYSNSTTGTGLTYAWNFGGGNTAATMNAQFIYTATGNFNPTLTVTDNNNCSLTTSAVVSIGAPVASFSALNAVNDTVCQTVTFVINGSTGNLLFDYGDGTSGTAPVHTYALPGNYNVTLTVQSGACSDDTTISIVVEEILAAFTHTPTYGCQWPSSVQFTNQSVNAASYFWMFGDGDTSNATNPTHVYESLDTNRFTIYNNPVIFFITLTATSAHGCVSNTFSQDTVFPPTARFMPDKAYGCAPLTVAFADSSISFENIVSRKWLFGDGGTATGNNTLVNHTYTNPGIYYAYLIITNSAGCIDTSYEIVIYVGEPPAPTFTVTPTDVCVHVPVQLTNTTSPGDSAQYFHYTADGGFLSHCFTDPNPVWQWNHTTGPQSITLTATYNGCSGSTTVPNAITVHGPLAHFYTVGNCATPYTYVMQGDIQDATTWTWDFGDGTVLTNSTNQTPSHTYANTGTYNIILTAFNPSSGCPPDVETVQVKVRDLQGAFTTAPKACSGTEIDFDATAAADVFPNCYKGYLFYWGDNQPPHNQESPLASHTYQQGGYFQPMLIVTDENGCKDTVIQEVRIYEPHAFFKSNKTYGCVPFAVNFTDSSYADTTIVQWDWDFGDGTTSTAINPSHTFTAAGTPSWVVRLIVTDAFGCKDTMYKIITNSIPDANFTANTTTAICAGGQVSFSAVSLGLQSYAWTFGNGTSATGQTVTATYPLAGLYNVTLTVTDSINCQRSITNTALVSVQNYPLAGFTSSADTLFNKCYPLLVTFTDTSIATVFGIRYWDLGNGALTLGNPTVGTIYQAPGTYTISLVVITTNGCADTVSRSITIEGPVGNFNILPDTICSGQAITFSIKDTVDVLSYNWDFGDGSFAAGVSPITHTFNINPPSGQTTVSLVMWSPDSACTATKTNTIYIHPVIAGFSVAGADTVYCLNEPVVLSNTSSNASTNLWNFGNGNTYNGVTPPPFMYTTPGVYPISLIVSNGTTGCADTLTQTLNVLGIPQASAVGADTCQGIPVSISASGGVSYLWTPATGLNNDTLANPIASPTSTTNYLVTVYDQNGCTDTASATVLIYEPAIPVIWDTVMVIGQTTQLNVYNGEGYTYSWSPTTGLSCTTCPNPIAQPLVNTVYYVTITDPDSCFSTTSVFTLDIKPITTVDVPTAFTPNGDSDNDIIYVDGLGIKRLIEFKIFNRWGQLLFETTDISRGWDGYYMGKLQNIETYMYVARVETWLEGQVLEKKGSFNLIR